MRKEGLFIFALFLLIVLNGSLALGETTALENLTEEERIDLAYQCLYNEIEDISCSRLSLDEQIFSLLTTGECYDEVMDASRLGECWPKAGCSIETTSLAALALKNNGEDIEKPSNWISDNNLTTTKIKWYLQIDAKEQTNCTINYSNEAYEIKIAFGKKLEEKNGETNNCFSIDEDYRIKINEACYNKKFDVSCDSRFKTSFLFKEESSNFIFVSDLTDSGSADEKVELEVNSRCFGKEVCNYEESLWASLALSVNGEKLYDYLPYLIAFKNKNKEFLPDSFLHFITGEENYKSNLISEQNTEGYWDKSGNKYYDTSVALFPLINRDTYSREKAIEWLKEEQEDTGCWEKNNVKTTAFILFSAWPKYTFDREIINESAEETNNTETNNTERERPSEVEDSLICERNHGYCMPGPLCYENGGNVLEDYECKGWDSCCNKEIEEETCRDIGGESCNSNEECSGEYDYTVPEDNCCVQGECIEKNANSKTPEEEKSECELNEGICKDECGNGEKEENYFCTESSETCCVIKEKNNSWIWFLVFGILIILAVLALLFKDKIEEFLNKKNNKPKKPSKSSPIPRHKKRFPLRRIPRKKPPINSPPNQQINKNPQTNQNNPSLQQRKTPNKDPKKIGNRKNSQELDDVLKKLKEMGK